MTGAFWVLNIRVDSGLYCEQVIGKNEKLLVQNALLSEDWKNNPDMKHGMLCYLGFPIRQTDGSLFGTICLLDDKENCFSPAMITLVEKMRDLIEAHLNLLRLGDYDQLTGAFNRTFFNKRAAEEIIRADRDHTPITMLILDIDHFKRVNDDFGHLVGDEVLKKITRILASSQSGTGIVTRFGGDEFIVLMPNIPVCEAMPAAESIRAQIDNHRFMASVKVTVSIGAAEYVVGETFEDWFKHADLALYKAKNSGRNLAIVYDRRDVTPITCVCIAWKREWNSGNEQIDKEHRKILIDDVIIGHMEEDSKFFPYVKGCPQNG